MAGRRSTSAFRWFDLDIFSYSSSLRSSILRWPRFLSGTSSYLLATTTATTAPSRWVPRGWVMNWDPRRLLSWTTGLSFSIVDEVVWSLVTAFESVALVSMLCFFFLFCGCTV